MACGCRHGVVPVPSGNVQRRHVPIEWVAWKQGIAAATGARARPHLDRLAM